MCCRGKKPRKYKGAASAAAARATLKAAATAAAAAERLSAARTSRPASTTEQGAGEGEEGQEEGEGAGEEWDAEGEGEDGDPLAMVQGMSRAARRVLQRQRARRQQVRRRCAGQGAVVWRALAGVMLHMLESMMV